jgi:hypothetical protein
VVKYKVDNFSPKTIYLVHQKKLDFVVENDTITISSPSPIPNGHDGFDYSFTKIIKGKNYQGSLTVPGDSYQETGPYRVNIALGYIDDLTDLDQHSIGSRHPAFLRGALRKQLEFVWIGNLRVDILKD